MICVGVRDIHTMELFLKWNVMFALIQLLILSRTNFARWTVDVCTVWLCSCYSKLLVSM